ncbi:acetyl esterase [Streptacidiphilus sp. MAP12-20]|uniref:alpha/beta hydrolase n=1 Tax=Streptacidiphilus sp. MAP12-20 TaxID=3156299 RepID=UPI00351347FC
MTADPPTYDLPAADPLTPVGPLTPADPLSPAARLLCDTMAAAFPDPAAGPLDAAALRRAASARGPRGVPAVASVTQFGVPGPDGCTIPVRAYDPEPVRDAGAAAGRPLIVFLHGGGWVLGDLDTHDGLCRELAHRTGAMVLSVDYRRAPEHRFPAALDDTRSVLRWASANAAALGCDPACLVLAGDSSGGNLAAAAASPLRGPRAAAQLLIYPALDPALDGPSARTFARGFFHTTAHMRWYWQQYLGPTTSPTTGPTTDPAAAPGLAPDLTGLPPTLIVLADCDPLRDEGLAYARRLGAAGVPVQVHLHPGVFHGFLGGAGHLPAADAALDAASQWLVRTVGTTQQPSPSPADSSPSVPDHAPRTESR